LSPFTSPVGHFAPGEFREAVFHQAASFDDVKFGGSDFEGVEFRGGVSMRRCSFDSRANFRFARFAADADFSDSEFKEVVFDDVVFTKVLFSRVFFERRPSFARAAFLGESSFGGARFRENTVFERVRFPVEVRFDDADLRGMTFRDCDLAGARFRNAYGISEADFDGVGWKPIAIPRTWAGRHLPRVVQALAMTTAEGVIVEEDDARTQDRTELFSAAEHVYRELRRSAERHRRLRRANGFSVRELEMRRLGLDAGGRIRLRSEWISLEAGYLHLSRYGQSILKPLLWLLGSVVLIFPHLFALSGVRLAGQTFAFAPIGTRIDGAAYAELLTFSIRTAALLPDPPDAHLEVGAQIAQVALRIIGPFLGFLFAVAIRSRFRR
jgi:uncharacterized protein YjbI with pentapeptide repeats